jgi:hypothetical protein
MVDGMRRTPTTAAVALVVLLAGCGNGGGRATDAATTTTRQPMVAATDTTTTTASCTSTTTVAGSAPGPETNPPGDIPDDQAFVSYTPGPSTYTVKVPEGWARTDGRATVSFTDKLNTIDITLAASQAAPSVASVKRDEVPRVASSTPCFELRDVADAPRSAGTFVLMTYRARSKADEVTGKTRTLDVERYELWRNGTTAVLTLSGPAGSDNVDPWRIVTDSFSWSA